MTEILKVLLAFAGIAILGCSEVPKPPTVDPVATAEPAPPILPATAKADERPLVQPPPTAPVEPAAKMPDDLGGKAVLKAMRPTPGKPVDLPGLSTPRPRATDLDRGELPVPAVAWKLPSSAVLLPVVKPAKPSIPTEYSPVHLGQAAAENLSGVKFAEKPLARADAPVNPGATDVPALARQIPERASVEDPTADISSGRLIETAFPYPVGALPFLKVTIPDPFEFAEQLKGKLPRETEFGTAPSAVPPEKK